MTRGHRVSRREANSALLIIQRDSTKMKQRKQGNGKVVNEILQPANLYP